ncbi:hypothetical protein VD0004_g7490 [Verticillium dahliae]|nr:hypothetical protein VD0004_g7490 [Verticillium dahliae]PNH71189.1 hypothetical protein VD0001_g6377 [Verticillium dahliae]
MTSSTTTTITTNHPQHHQAAASTDAMAPLTPHWTQPSHPDVQEVIKASETEFLTKSLSKVALPPFAVFSKMSFPPCTLADKPTYATVQCGKDKHLDLNSDMLYINHSCDPSLIFDTGNLNILVGPKGLQPGDELTFFYPSTEWSMAQPFDCFCGAPTCRGTISGARDMTDAQLDGLWLNGHIRELLDERRRSNGSNGSGAEDPTARALQEAVSQAERGVEAARAALRAYTEAHGSRDGVKGVKSVNGDADFPSIAGRRGASSRELAGEMGGDTIVV